MTDKSVSSSILSAILLLTSFGVCAASAEDLNEKPVSDARCITMVPKNWLAKQLREISMAQSIYSLV